MANGQASVSFSPPASNGGAPITEYIAMAFIAGVPTGTFNTGAGSPITVTGLVNGTTYTFEVYAINAVGAGPFSAPSNPVTPMATVPSAPLNPAAVAGNAEAFISFSAPLTNGGSLITLYTATSTPGGMTGSVSGFGVITVTGLTNATAYTFTVTATNAIGTGPASVATASVTPTSGTTVPSAPLSPSAEAGSAEAFVYFSPPASTGGSTITGYVATSTPGSIQVDGASSPITVTGLTNGDSYTFVVQAINGVGTGPASVATNAVTPTATPTVPTAPLSPSASAGNAQATVSFSPPSSNGGEPITSYTATSTPGNLTASAASSPITVTGLTNGVLYSFKVTATNSVGTGPASVASNQVTPATAPGAPTGPLAAGINDGAEIFFTPPASTGGSAIISYTAVSTPGSFTGTNSTSPVTVTGLTNGTSYTFKVLATNAIGNGPYSVATSAVIPSAVPGAPTDVVATAVTGQITITFGAAANNGSPILQYTATSFPEAVSVAGSGSPIAVPNADLTIGTSYTFDVVATNANGGGPPGTSNSATPGMVPGPPLSATAVAGNTQATVSFLAPASTGGATITSYTAYASPGTASASDGPALSITVTGLTNGTPYTFTVKATNTFGTGAASVATSPPVTPSAGGFIIEDNALPNGTVGIAYTGTITAEGGVPPYSYFVVTGALPPGTALNESTGAIAGTPTTANTYNPGFQATDSSGSSSYPNSTTVCDNEGDGAVQHQGGIASTSSVALVASMPCVCLTTCATYDNGIAHNGRGLATTNGDTTALQTYLQGPLNTAPGDPLNASQETDLWLINNPTGGVTTFHQWFGTAGYGGANVGDADYQAFLAFQYSSGSTFLGHGAFTAQTGTGYAGVAHNTALISGSITLTSAQLPCRLYGFCTNTSSLGTNFIASPNVVSGITPVNVLNIWGFGAGAGAYTSNYSYWDITAPGNYAASFNQNSTSLNCFQTVCWAVKGAGTGNAETPVQVIPMVISGSSGGAPAAPANVWITAQGQLPTEGAGGLGTTSATGYGGAAPTGTMSIAWTASTGATTYQVYRSTNGTTYSAIGSPVGGTAYTDGTAANCVNPNPGPNGAGVYFAATTYWYKVQAINTSGASPLSASQKGYVYYNGSTGGITNPALNTGQANGGLKWFGEFQDASTANRLVSAYDANVGPSESGSDISLQNSGSPYWLPVAGWVYPVYDMWGGAFDYLYFDIFIATGSGAAFQIHGEVTGDLLITNGNFLITPYLTQKSTAAGGVWWTCKIPLTTLMTGTVGGTGYTPVGVLQQEIYKFLLQLAAGTANGCAIDNVYYGP